MATIYVSIGNSDDKLPQAQWALFVQRVEGYMSMCEMHGAWYSGPSSPFQNACWCIESPRNEEALKHTLRDLARIFGQDSIAWAVAETEFLAPAEIPHA